MILVGIINDLLTELKADAIHLFANKYNPGIVHDFRVKIRQLRSFFYFIKPLLNESDYHNCQSELKSLGYLFSEIRELDVMIEYWQSLSIEKNSMIPYPNELSQYFDQKLIDTKNHLYKNTDEVYILQKLNSIDSNYITRDINFNNKKDLNSFCEKRIEKIANKLSKDLTHLDNKNDRKIHRTRITAKKLRYSINCIQPYVKTDFRCLKKNSKKTTELLGIICDCNKIIEFLNKNNNHNYNSSIKLNYEKGFFEGLLIKKKNRHIKKLNKILTDLQH